MAINAKEGHKLPDNIKEYGKEIVEELKNEDGTRGAFLHPNGSMFVVGGPKNPDVKLNKTQDEAMNEISSLFNEYSDKMMEKEENETPPPMPEFDENSLGDNVKINEFGEIERKVSNDAYDKLLKSREEKEEKEALLEKGKNNLEESRNLMKKVKEEKSKNDKKKNMEDI